MRVARQQAGEFGLAQADLLKRLRRAGVALRGAQRGGVQAQAFAHDLAHAGIRPGSSDQSAVAPQTVPTVAHELVAMFRDPKTIRQVILLREVLDRPIDRW